MARKSPRARKKPGPGRRMPAKAATRTRPGKGRAARSAASTRSSARGGSAGPRRTGAPGGARSRAGAHSAAKRLRPAGRGKVAGALPGRRSVTAAKTISRPSRRRFTPPDPARVQPILGILDRLYPEARTALRFENPLQLLVATILSAQCTDERVNRVTPTLFARYPDAASLAGASQEDLEDVIRSTGFFRNKARAIRACCTDIVQKHGGEVPNALEVLTSLHGVGRKTANVVLGNAFGIPGLVVDTHVTRLANRLGLTNETDPVKIEFALMSIVPREQWTLFSHWLILHGRKVCVSRRPRCSICPLAPHCPRVGVTASN